jgi:hypothetical protein
VSTLINVERPLVTDLDVQKYDNPDENWEVQQQIRHNGMLPSFHSIKKANGCFHIHENKNIMWEQNSGGLNSRSRFSSMLEGATDGKKDGRER